ncbi:MAG: LAGLIDADG family homing endonuclease [Candidatus Aenigmarchaeota archaeon]|nr:LAGLIDADG family homing endonuclease [Candidatus Aenigmarchaeota archaeon]
MKIIKEILEEAKNLYLEGNSIRKVAKLIQEKYGIKMSKETVRRHLSKAVKLRNKKEVMTMKRGNLLDEAKIVELYTKMLLSMKQIAKLFNASASGIKWILLKNGIKPRSKRGGLKIRIGKYEKPSFNGTKVGRAYLIGITLGDLTVRRNSTFTIEVNTSTTRKTMINLLVDVFKEYSDGVICSTDEKRGFRFCAYLDKSFDFLLKAKEDIEIIKEFNEEEFLSFLAGFFDAEGSLINRKHRNSRRWVAKIGNTNRRILEIIKKYLEKIGIISNIYLYSRKGKRHDYFNRRIINRKDYYVLEISRKKDCIKLLQLLPIKHPEKLERKELFLNNLKI